MGATMSRADEARSIAQQLIPDHHPHLRAAEILYVFTDQRRKRCDRVRLGSAAKLSSLQRFLASGQDGVEEGPDFVILIDVGLWQDMPKEQRVALIDHELCHCALFVRRKIDGWRGWYRWTPDMDPPREVEETRWGMRGHDIEEFGEVLYRHGFWKPDSPERKFGEIVAMQLKLQG